MTMTFATPIAHFVVTDPATNDATDDLTGGDSSAGDHHTWERACAVTDLELSWGEAALVRMKQIALFLLSPTEIYAVEHRDPHTDAYVMARGIVGSRGDRPTIASPLHKQVYDLGTGECFSDPSLVLTTYQTRIVGGFIEVAVEA